jgi:hypothetical protein
LVLLSPHEKSLDFSDSIGEILEYFESLNNDYDLLRNQVLDSLEEFYLKMQKFIEE